MSEYKLMGKDDSQGVLRLADSAYISNAPGNIDWEEYVKWKNAGNTPSSQFDIEQYRIMRKNELNAFRAMELRKKDRIVSASGFQWQVDPMSITELNNAITLYRDREIPEGFVWRDANNTNHSADLELLLNISDAFSTIVNAIYQYSWQLKEQLNSASTIEEIDAITWNFTI